MSAHETPHLETFEEVMFFDTDAGGVVHNIAYLRFVETNRTRLAALIGLDVAGMMQRQQFPVVVRTEIDYRRSACFAERLIVRGWLDSIERARFWCRFEIVRAPNGEQLITCRQALALVQMPKAKPLRLPSAWREQWPGLIAAGRGGN